MYFNLICLLKILYSSLNHWSIHLLTKMGSLLLFNVKDVKSIHLNYRDREEGGLSHAGHRKSMDSITYCLVSPKYHRLHLLPCLIRDLSAGNDESVHCPMQWKITAFACTASTPPYYGLTLLFLLH